jgi:hypothetical protein
MNVTTEKLSIINQIIATDDEAILLTIRNLLELRDSTANQKSDFWDILSEKQKNAVHQSIKELDNGEGIPNDIVMDMMRKKLSR